jgi:hypothetical protein
LTLHLLTLSIDDELRRGPEVGCLLGPGGAMAAAHSRRS